MPITLGTRLGPYEITGMLGVGGMGEVYRALDTRLKRDVALKVLPESFAADPERLARFQREAESLPDGRSSCSRRWTIGGLIIGGRARAEACANLCE